MVRGAFFVLARSCPFVKNERATQSKDPYGQRDEEVPVDGVQRCVAHARNKCVGK